MCSGSPARGWGRTRVRRGDRGVGLAVRGGGSGNPGPSSGWAGIWSPGAPGKKAPLRSLGKVAHDLPRWGVGSGVPGPQRRAAAHTLALFSSLAVVSRLIALGFWDPLFYRLVG